MGGMGTQPGPEVAPWRDGGIFRTWMGTEGLKRDRKGCREGGMGTQGHRKEWIFRTQVGSEWPQREARMGTQRVTDGGMGGQGHRKD